MVRKKKNERNGHTTFNMTKEYITGNRHGSAAKTVLKLQARLKPNCDHRGYRTSRRRGSQCPIGRADPYIFTAPIRIMMGGNVFTLSTILTRGVPTFQLMGGTNLPADMGRYLPSTTQGRYPPPTTAYAADGMPLAFT